MGWDDGWVHTPHHNFNTFSKPGEATWHRTKTCGSFIGSLALTKVIVKQVVDGLGEVSKLGRHGVEVVCVCGCSERRGVSANQDIRVQRASGRDRRTADPTRQNTPQKGARTNARGQVGDTSRERCGSLTRAECSKANDLAAVWGARVQSRCVLEGVGEEEEGRRWESGTERTSEQAQKHFGLHHNPRRWWCSLCTRTCEQTQEEARCAQPRAIAGRQSRRRTAWHMREGGASQVWL